MQFNARHAVMGAVLGLVAGLGCHKPVENLGAPDAGTVIYLPPVGNDGGDGPDGGDDPMDGGVDPDGGTDPLAAIVDLRADVNRNGTIDLDDPTEDEHEAEWTATHGAIFLANIDDDEKKCPFSWDYKQISDVQLAQCSDAADDVINGDNDLLDLANLRTAPWPDAPDDATGRLTVEAGRANRVRLFRGEGTSFTEYVPGTELSAVDLRAGVRFAIEGRDIVRDARVWDGFVDLKFSVTFDHPVDGTKTVEDVVRMRVSPVMTFHHLEPAELIFVSALGGDPDSTQFQADVGAATTAAGIVNPVYKVAVFDQWTQDFFETGYMSMPSTGGRQHVIRVNFRSANVWYPGRPTSPLREAGRIAHLLRGRDSAAVQQYDRFSPQDMDTLNSFGNTETIPPYTHNGVSWPLGRILRGNVPSFHPDQTFSRMLEDQKIQAPLYVDTSWLLVAHVDETISFIKANTPRGWLMVVNDPRLAKQMLEDEVAKGNGNTKMFVGKSWLGSTWDEYPAEVTINQVLADTDVMNESAKSAAHIDDQVAIIKAATGITEQEIIRIPYLHEPVDGYSVAYQPGTVNMLVFNDGHVAPPDPFGPVINGKDIFKEQFEQAFAAHGYIVHWIDDWNLYHRLSGEVHCGTNAARRIPAAKWWESGR